MTLWGRESGLLVRPGVQRTYSTHVLAAVCRLNRLENTAEHLRRALNTLAAAASDWLQRTVVADWFGRYRRRIEDWLGEQHCGAVAIADADRAHAGDQDGGAGIDK